MELAGALWSVLLSTSAPSVLVVVEVVEPAEKDLAVLAIRCSSASCCRAPMSSVLRPGVTVLCGFAVEDLAAIDLGVLDLESSAVSSLLHSMVDTASVAVGVRSPVCASSATSEFLVGGDSAVVPVVLHASMMPLASP